MMLQPNEMILSQIKCLIKENRKTLPVLKSLAKVMTNSYSSELCCYQMMNHPEWKEVISGLFILLGRLDQRFSRSAAYIIGTLFKNEVCNSQITDWMLESHNDVVNVFLSNLNALLKWHDEEILLNVSAILASMAASSEGRLWLLKQYAFDDTLNLLCMFLHSQNISLLHNASLVIARISIVEEGCARILNQRCVQKYLLCFIMALDFIDCQYNMVVTISCLFNLESGQRNMLSMQESSDMIEKLVNLLFTTKVETKKGSCFALGLLASNKQGNQRIVEYHGRDKMLLGVVNFLKDADELTSYSIFFFKSLVVHKNGCIMLRDHKTIKFMLMEISNMGSLPSEHLMELNYVLLNIDDLPEPPPPVVKVKCAFSVCISWEVYVPKNKFQVFFHILQDSNEICKTCDSSFVVDTLKPFSKYSFAMFYSCEGATSCVSKAVVIETPESVPSAPMNFRVIFSSTSQLKLCWDEPTEANGVIKGYELSVVGKSVCISLKSKSYLMTHLQPFTQYQFEVCALTSQGRGSAAFLTATTNTLDSFAPPPPQLHVHGKSEIFIQWDPPKKLLGRINYYELRMDDEVIYQGIDRCFTVQALHPTKVYSFTVSAWMNEGRCESLPRTRRISKHRFVTSSNARKMSLKNNFS